MDTNAVNKILLLPICLVVSARLRIMYVVYSRDIGHSKTKQKDSKAHILFRLTCAINTCDATAQYTYLVFSEYRIYESKSTFNTDKKFCGYLRILWMLLLRLYV
jgi:hypothetical protein